MARGKMNSTSAQAGPKGRSRLAWPQGAAPAASAPTNKGGTGSTFNAFEGPRGESQLDGAIHMRLFIKNHQADPHTGIPVGQKLSGKDAQLHRA